MGVVACQLREFWTERFPSLGDCSPGRSRPELHQGRTGCLRRFFGLPRPGHLAINEGYSQSRVFITPGSTTAHPRPPPTRTSVTPSVPGVLRAVDSAASLALDAHTRTRGRTLPAALLWPVGTLYKDSSVAATAFRDRAEGLARQGCRVRHDNALCHPDNLDAARSPSPIRLSEEPALARLLRAGRTCQDALFVLVMLGSAVARDRPD